jgi:hypothetical protein
MSSSSRHAFRLLATLRRQQSLRGRDFKPANTRAAPQRGARRQLHGQEAASPHGLCRETQFETRSHEAGAAAQTLESAKERVARPRRRCSSIGCQPESSRPNRIHVEGLVGPANGMTATPPFRRHRPPRPVMSLGLPIQENGHRRGWLDDPFLKDLLTVR